MTSSIDNAVTTADRTNRIAVALGEGGPPKKGPFGRFVGWSVKTSLVIGLATLSWLATYTGMLELIRANAGTQDLGLGLSLAIAFAVAMLMLMIIYILDQLFTDMALWMRGLFIGGYIFLTLISVGFGFGFYWKFLEARSEATRSAEAAVTTVQGALQTGQTRLEQLAETLTALTVLSANKAIQEREKGNTCPNSRPGDGPRRRLRDADAANFNVAAQFIGGRVGKVKEDIGGLNRDLKLISSGAKTDPVTGRSIVDSKTGTRNAFLKDMGRRINLTINRFNSLRTDPQLKQYRDNFAERSAKTVFPNGGGGTFRCPDPHLQSALLGAVRAIDSLPVIKNPKVAAVEGSEAIIEAFRRLATSFFGALTFKLPPDPDELRELQRQAVQKAGKNSKEAAAVLEQVPGLGHRDYIPLFVAIFVDFCLLLVSINRPVHKFRELTNLVSQARAETLRGLLLDYYHVSHGEQEKQFEQLQHVIFDFAGDYYAAVPLNSEDKDARYLATLFAALEGKGVVKRGLFMVNFFGWGNYFVRYKLSMQNSRFANENVFRLYRFHDGAWSELVRNVSLEAASIEKVRQSERDAKEVEARERRDEVLRQEREEQLEREKEERELRHKLEMAQIEKGLKDLGIGPRFDSDAGDNGLDRQLPVAAASGHALTVYDGADTGHHHTESAPELTVNGRANGTANGHTHGHANGSAADSPNGHGFAIALNGHANQNSHQTNGHETTNGASQDLSNGRSRLGELVNGLESVRATSDPAPIETRKTASDAASEADAARTEDGKQIGHDFSALGEPVDPNYHEDHRDRVNFDAKGNAGYLELDTTSEKTEAVSSNDQPQVNEGIKALADRLMADRSAKNSSENGAVQNHSNFDFSAPIDLVDPIENDQTHEDAANGEASNNGLSASLEHGSDGEDENGESIRDMARMLSRGRKIAEKFKPEPTDVSYDDTAEFDDARSVYELDDDEIYDDEADDDFARSDLSVIPDEPDFDADREIKLSEIDRKRFN